MISHITVPTVSTQRFNRISARTRTGLGYCSIPPVRVFLSRYIILMIRYWQKRAMIKGGVIMQDKNRPWEQIYHITLACGNVHEKRDFAVEVLNQFLAVCSFDEALIYFFNENGAVMDQYLWNIDERWSSIFLQYYTKVKDFPYTVYRPWKEASNVPVLLIHDWRMEPKSEFLRDYIHPRGIWHSLGFVLTDMNGMPRTVFSLDRTSVRPYDEKELGILNLLIPPINNLHKNFFCQETNYRRISSIAWNTTELTKREIEVANLLCQGVSPRNISRTLNIEITTTNKHIANIYKKMQVSSRQELMVRLMR